MTAVDPGVWSGTPAPGLALQWQIGDADVPGATGASYTPVPADDLKGLRCVVTASNASGSATAATEAVGVSWAPPSVTDGLADQVFDLGGGVRTVDAAAAFAGGGLSFSVTGAGAMVDVATGIVSIGTATARSAEPVTVTAANSGGTVAVTFNVTVRAAPAAPVLSGVTADSAASPPSFSWTVDEPGTAWWALSASAYATGAQVEAHSGAVAHGSFPNAAGPSTQDIDLSSVPPGSYTLSVTVKNSAGIYSNVDSSPMTITEVVAPAYSPQWVEFSKGDGEAWLNTDSDFDFPESIDSYTLVYAFSPTQFSAGSLLLTPVTSAHYLTQIEIGAAGKLDIKSQDSASVLKGRVYTNHALTLGDEYLMLVSMDRNIRSSVALISLDTGTAISLPVSVNAADFPMANPFNPNSPAGWSVPNAVSRGVRLERVALWLGTYVDVNDSGVQRLFHDNGALKSPDVARATLGAEDIGLYDGELVTGDGTVGTFTPTVSGTGSITAV